MKNRPRYFLLIVTLFVLSSLFLQGCGGQSGTSASTLTGQSGTSAAVSGSSAGGKTEVSSTGSWASGTSSIDYSALNALSTEVYNRTGKIQRTEFYAPSACTVEYSYDDSGRLTAVKRTGGELGSNRPMETYLYSGTNCTQHVVYDENGSTQEATYWTYDKKDRLTKKRVVTMLLSGSGSGYSGKSEDITEYGEDGLAICRTYTAPGEWAKDEYGYNPDGLLVTDNYYCSSDGENWTFFETTSYAYDAEGRTVREARKDSTGSFFYVRLYEYDEAGNLLSDAVYSSDTLSEENCRSRHLYEYSEAGLRTFEVSFSGTDSTQVYYQYNEAGKTVCISETKYRNGTSQGTTVTKTEYDSRGSAVRETVTAANGQSSCSYIRGYEYYDDGKIKKKTDYDCKSS